MGLFEKKRKMKFLKIFLKILISLVRASFFINQTPNCLNFQIFNFKNFYRIGPIDFFVIFYRFFDKNNICWSNKCFLTKMKAFYQKCFSFFRPEFCVDLRKSIANTIKCICRAEFLILWVLIKWFLSFWHTLTHFLIESVILQDWK